MAKNSASADLVAFNMTTILDQAIFQAMELRETILNIDNSELMLMIDILMFGLGQAAASCVRPRNIEKVMCEAA